MTDIHIEQIRPEVTWRLRREVLYPDEPLHAMEMEEDDHGIHLAAFTETDLVAVVSLFPNGTDFQFRKFAVAPTVQGKGIGTLLLHYIIDFVRNEGGKRIWCNARDTAVGFYLRDGFKSTGEKFTRSGVNFEIMEKFL